MYDYFLGGAHNFAVDREAAQQLFAIYPDLPLVSQANRAMLRRAVHFLVGEGIEQFLDVGSGIPTAGNVHEVAQRLEPSALLHFVPDDDVARFIVRSFRDAVPSGSYFVITHATTERIEASGRERVEQLYKNASSP